MDLRDVGTKLRQLHKIWFLKNHNKIIVSQLRVKKLYKYWTQVVNVNTRTDIEQQSKACIPLGINVDNLCSMKVKGMNRQRSLSSLLHTQGNNNIILIWKLNRKRRRFYWGRFRNLMDWVEITDSSVTDWNYIVCFRCFQGMLGHSQHSHRL